jgi:CRISPR-associated protein Cas1
MKKTYYLFNPGRLSRRDNTLKFTPVDEDGMDGNPKFLPVEGVQNLMVFGSLDANSSLYNLLGKNGISLHFFDYYEHYTGSFFPKEYLLSGKLLIEQSRHYMAEDLRIKLAYRFIEGASFNILKNLRYYQNREKSVQPFIENIEQICEDIPNCHQVDELMGLEGNIRQIYYDSFEMIMDDFKWVKRTKQPPTNELNALVSFGNMMCYTLCLDQIYHTQLNPTISYLHQPGERRFSLALDLAEIFKPLLVDRTIFRVINKKEVTKKDFDKKTNYVTLKEKGKKAFIKAWEEKINETIKHRSLKKSVSYKHLVKLECYKLSKHILGIEEYKPFKAWW